VSITNKDEMCGASQLATNEHKGLIKSKMQRDLVNFSLSKTISIAKIDTTSIAFQLIAYLTFNQFSNNALSLGHESSTTFKLVVASMTKEYSKGTPPPQKSLHAPRTPTTGRGPRAGAGATAVARALRINLQATLPKTSPSGGMREPAETGTTVKGGGDPHQHGRATQCWTTVAIAIFADCPHVGNVVQKSGCNKGRGARRKGTAW
jgi:hypothetical protein